MIGTPKGPILIIFDEYPSIAWRDIFGLENQVLHQHFSERVFSRTESFGRVFSNEDSGVFDGREALV